MSHPSWVAAANGSLHNPGHRLRSLSLQPYSQDFHDLRLAGTPTRWHPDYTQTRNTYFQRSESAGASISSGLEPIPEGRAADYRQRHALAAGHPRANNVKDTAQRRHSEGDLLGDPGRWRFVKRTPQQENRRRSSQGDFQTSSDIAVRSGSSVQAKRKVSVIAWPDDTSDGRIVQDARPDLRRQSSQASDPDLAPRRVSVHAMRQNSQTDGSVGTVEEVTSKSRRKSAGSRSVAGSDMSAATRKASTISLTATAIDSSQPLASRATLASVDIPLDFLQQPVTRLNTVLRPVLMLVLVLTLAASLGAALYFAVVLNRAQAREIAYLRATLRLPLQESEYQSLVVQPSSQKEEFGQEFCKWIDQRYQTSVLASKYRGCRVSSLDHKELLFLLYFYKAQNVTSQEVREDDIINVLTSSATNETGGVVILDKVHVQTSAITVLSLTVSTQGPEAEVKDTVRDGHSSAQSSLRTSSVTPVTTPSVTSVTLPGVTSATSPSVTPVTPPSVTPASSPSVTPVTLPGVTPVTPLSVTPPTYASTGQLHFFNASAAATTSLTPVPARDPLHPCLPDENEKRYRYPGSCSIFFQCLHGRAITMACDSSLVFDVTLNVCQVTTPDCHETSATTQDSDAARPCEKMSGMYFPHPAACNLYIQCSNNITNVRICPDTLVFNPDTSTCIKLTPDFVCP